MGNEIVKSERQTMIEAARRQLAEIETTSKAREKDAARACDLLIGSYPQQKAHTPEVYMRQVRNLLNGVPLSVVMQLVDPNRGILGECIFLPTIAELSKWLHKALEPRREEYRRQVTVLETLNYDAGSLDAATREHRRATLQALTDDMRKRHASPAQIAEALDAKMAERFAKTQRHEPQALLDSLANQEPERDA